jgi:hypothetical protein
MRKLVSVIAGVLLFAVSGFAQDNKDIVAKAMSEMGVYKMPGMSDARVREYVETTGNPLEMYTQDGWCASFVAWVLKATGFEYSAYPTMDEWLYCGTPTDNPQLGDIVFIPGHIAFFDGWVDLPGFTPHTVFNLLGGNQNHRVCVFPLGEGWAQIFLHPTKAPIGWVPRKHFGFDLTSAENRLDDKTNIMSVMEYQFHPQRDTRIPSTTPPGF